MATADFGPFFAATAAVAGALVGLLFVALSVAPSARTPRNGSSTDVRAGIAFSCLVNPLAVSLFALIPGLGVGLTVGRVIGIVSFASCVALVLVLLRETASGPLRRRQLLRLTVQALVFAYSAVVGSPAGPSRPHDLALERTVCVLIVVLFLIGIARAWQLIGAREPRWWARWPGPSDPGQTRTPADAVVASTPGARSLPSSPVAWPGGSTRRRRDLRPVPEAAGR